MTAGIQFTGALVSRDLVAESIACMNSSSGNCVSQPSGMLVTYETMLVMLGINRFPSCTLMPMYWKSIELSRNLLLLCQKEHFILHACRH